MTTQLQNIDHLVITVKSFESTAEFYTKLGFKAVKKSNRLELLNGNFKINVHLLGHEIEPHALNVRAGSADICLESSLTAEQLREQLCACGLAAEEEGVRHGARGEMYSFYLRDPDGNLVELSSYGGNINTAKQMLKSVVSKDRRMADFFWPDARITLVNTCETFDPAGYADFNCAYPGNWLYETERMVQSGDTVIIAARVYEAAGKSFHEVMFAVFCENRIKTMHEYWGDDGEPPEWRNKK